MLSIKSSLSALITHLQNRSSKEICNNKNKTVASRRNTAVNCADVLLFQESCNDHLSFFLLSSVGNNQKIQGICSQNFQKSTHRFVFNRGASLKGFKIQAKKEEECEVDKVTHKDENEGNIMAGRSYYYLFDFFILFKCFYCLSFSFSDFVIFASILYDILRFQEVNLKCLRY